MSEEGGAAALNLLVDSGQARSYGDLVVVDEVKPLNAEDRSLTPRVERF